MNSHIKYLIISYIFIYGQNCNANETLVNNFTTTVSDSNMTPPPSQASSSTDPSTTPQLSSLMPYNTSSPYNDNNNNTIEEKIKIINISKINDTIELVTMTNNGSLDDESAAAWLLKLHRFGEDTLKMANKTNIFVVYSLNIVVCIVAVMGLLLGLFKCYRPRQWLLHTFLRDFRRMINADQQQQQQNI